ncbi:hypothetical protein IIV6-T1_401 [Invertebrate iridescent virus 6]|nr:hypothetical protein IIV6-T1_401 [Invertebrate iridescent virus 6]
MLKYSINLKLFLSKLSNRYLTKHHLKCFFCLVFLIATKYNHLLLFLLD